MLGFPWHCNITMILISLAGVVSVASILIVLGSGMQFWIKIRAVIAVSDTIAITITAMVTIQ